MKIGFVLDDTLDSTDGVQQYVLTLGGWLGTHGHDVHYLVGRTERTDLPNIHSLSRNVSVRFNGNRMSMPLPADRTGIRELLNRERFDVLHVQMPYSPWMGGRVIRAAPAGTAIVGTFHIAAYSFFAALANYVLARWERRTLRRFDRIVSVSQAAADFAKRVYGITGDVLPCMVDVAYFRTPLKEAVGINESIPTIVFVGRLVPRKGCDVLLKAVKLLRQKYPDLQFKVVICGSGPLLADLQESVKVQELQDLVEFVGHVTGYKKVRPLQEASLAVFPSRAGETFGIVLIEAMAANGPVVLGADNPGYHCVLSPNPNLLFPVDDASQLSERMYKYLTDTTARRTALNWQQEYVQQFDVAVVAQKLLDVYAGAIETAKSS